MSKYSNEEEYDITSSKFTDLTFFKEASINNTLSTPQLSITTILPKNRVSFRSELDEMISKELSLLNHQYQDISLMKGYLDQNNSYKHSNHSKSDKIQHSFIPQLIAPSPALFVNQSHANYYRPIYFYTKPANFDIKTDVVIPSKEKKIIKITAPKDNT